MVAGSSALSTGLPTTRGKTVAKDTKDAIVLLCGVVIIATLVIVCR
jgi:hypothetical protein